MKIRLSASDAMVPGRTWTEKAELLHRLGYSGMTVFVDEPDWNDGMLEELLKLEERTGVRCCEFAFTGPLYDHREPIDKERLWEVCLFQVNQDTLS